MSMMLKRFTPPTDVIETEDALLVIVEVAGMKAEDFRIEASRHDLTISGFRQGMRTPHQAYHQVEIGYGDFLTRVRLPRATRTDAITAEYEAGFLVITLPYAPVTQIPVQTQATENPDT
jgi:HSP20 family protein